jgi:23S rRNA (adenine2503-C2)-methyltransferase
MGEKKNLNCEGIFLDSSDGTIKVVFSKFSNSKEIIEMTYIDNKTNTGVDVFCVPTHHYCNLGCKFCHLTQEKVNRGMSPIKSLDFIEAFIRTVYKAAPKLVIESGEVKFLDKNVIKRSTNKKCLISFMGVGEPLLNIKLIEEIYFNEELIKRSCGYSEISYAISTMMPNYNLKKLSDLAIEKKIPIKVHFSLHSPFSNERKELLPSTSLTVEDALKVLTNYRQSVGNIPKLVENMKLFHSNHIDPIEIHYTLIKGVNDTNNHLKKIIKLLNEYKIAFKILRFNAPIGMQESDNVDEWLNSLRKKLPFLKIIKYLPPGKAVGSSCGEFTKHYYLSSIETKEQKKEFLKWKQKHQIFE